MADESNEQGGFDPGAHRAPEVVEHLEGASEAEKAEIAAAELQRNTPRTTVLKAAGLDPAKRYDASGRELMAHEVAPKPREED